MSNIIPRVLVVLVVVSAIAGQAFGVGSSSTCSSNEDCRFACGSAVTKYKCHPEGYCSCVGKFLPANRCGEINESDKMCQLYCHSYANSVPRRCKTERGKICSCFKYSED